MQKESSSHKVHFPGLDWEAEEAKSKQGTQSRKARRARRREQKQHTDRMKEIEGDKSRLLSFLDSAQNSEEICQLPQLDWLTQLANQRGLTPREVVRLLLNTVDIWYPNEELRLLISSWKAGAISKGLYTAMPSQASATTGLVGQDTHRTLGGTTAVGPSGSNGAASRSASSSSSASSLSSEEAMDRKPRAMATSNGVLVSTDRSPDLQSSSIADSRPFAPSSSRHSVPTDHSGTMSAERSESSHSSGSISLASRPEIVGIDVVSGRPFGTLASFWPLYSNDAAGLNHFLSVIWRNREDLEQCEDLIRHLLDSIEDLNPQLSPSRLEEWAQAREEFEEYEDRSSAILSLYHSFRGQANPMATEDSSSDGSLAWGSQGTQSLSLSTGASPADESSSSSTQGSGRHEH